MNDMNNLDNLNNRESARWLCGNYQETVFSLFAPDSRLPCDFCICTDLSRVGAQFIVDTPFQPGEQLRLLVDLPGHDAYFMNVSVVRTDHELSDEERFCVAVSFRLPQARFNQLKQVLTIPGSRIAA